MICSNCGKREVEVVIKQVVDNEVKSINLCRQCAEELGYLSPSLPSITISFSVGEIDPSRMIKRRKDAARQKREESENELVCSECGTKFASFRKSGLLGCPSCYAAFRFPLGAYLQEHQNAESHWTDSAAFSLIDVHEETDEVSPPVEDDIRFQLYRLMEDLEAAIKREDYERAAEIRDKIERMKGRSS